MAGVRGLELPNVGLIECRPNPLLWQNIFVPETTFGEEPQRDGCGSRWSVCAWSWTSSMTHSEPNAPLRERMRLTRFWRPTRRTVSLQSVGNLWAPTASDIEGPTDLDWVGLCFETEISGCALDSCMAQERSNRLQIPSAFQNVESFRPA